jgi:hypothetical protein
MYICLESDVSFDDDLENIPYLKFMPYIGYDYFSSTPKTLILGHSRYWEENDVNKDDIRDYFDSTYGYAIKDNGTATNKLRAFRNTVAMITGKGYHYSDNEWKNMAYHVFFQGIVGKNSRDKSLITNELIEQSQKAYIDVIKILQPQLIIAWGIDDLYKEYVPQSNREIIDKENIVYKYTDFPDTIIWHILHPSGVYGFPLEDYQKRYLFIINKYFDQSKE